MKDVVPLRWRWTATGNLELQTLNHGVLRFQRADVDEMHEALAQDPGRPPSTGDGSPPRGAT